MRAATLRMMATLMLVGGFASVARGQLNQQTTGGGYGPLFGQATGTVGGSGTQAEVESWVNDTGISSCDIGSFNTAGACAAQAAPTAVAKQRMSPTSHYYFLYRSSTGRLWRIEANGVWTYLDELRHTIYINEPPHHNPVQCPQDGPYWCPGTPIIIPLGKDEPTYSAPDVPFDLDADGNVETVSWPVDGTNTAFLAIDQNGNGTIDNGSELFGDHTLQGASNGFVALARLAEQEAGVGVGELKSDLLDGSSALFRRLLLWTDANRDGISQPEELRPASSVLSQIGLALNVAVKPQSDSNGNLFWYSGWVRYNDGTRREVWDPILVAKKEQPRK
jgi:hypothetical protein